MRRALITGLALAGVVALIVLAASSGGSKGRTYRIELDNAFGIVTGADFKVAGVKAGTIQSISLDPKTLDAVVTVSVTQPGLGQFHDDATCISRPQSLIGEYFISCDPGSSGPVLPAGSTIAVSHTQSTIPADLLQNIMQVPYRERFSLIIGELGAGVAGRSGDLQAALQRAVPALTETDNLLQLLGNDDTTIQQLTTSSNNVITDLANNSANIKRFIVESNRAATDTAIQKANLQTTLHDLPGFLAQLRPALAKLGAATAANTPVLNNLNASANQLDRLFTILPAFSHASIPAIADLGRASVTGRSAVTAATPTVRALNQFGTNTPDLAQNLAIVTHVLDDRKYAVEKNPESPGGQGYTGLEALLQFAFNLAAATNYYGPNGHQLGVDAFVSAMCTPYASLGTIASNLKLFGSAARSCYAQLGPSQPGVNQTDPTDPSACVPDPGGVTPGETGPTTSATACGTTPARTPARGGKPASTPATTPTGAGSGSGAPTGSGSQPPSTGTGSGSGGLGGLGGVLGGLLGGATHSSGLGGVVSGLLGGTNPGTGASGAPSTGSGGTSGSSGLSGLLGGLLGGGKGTAQTSVRRRSSPTQSAQALLDFLLKP